MYAPDKPSLFARRDDRLGALPVAAIATAGVKKIFGGISFKTPSETRARRVIPAVVASANQGNLRAVAILDTRRNIGISAERAEWARGYGQVAQSILATYTPRRTEIVSGIPASAQSSPENAASWALQTPVTESQTTIQKISDVVVPAFLDTQAGREVKTAVVESAVQSQAAKVADVAKSSALPLALGAAAMLLFFGSGSSRPQK